MDLMDYSDATKMTHESLGSGPKLATSLKRLLSCRIADRAKVREPLSQHEREAALHIRKMIAEGEIIEEMQNKRLYYKSPLFV
jgi:hypothetical protein